MSTEPQWERYSADLDRIKADGGYIFRTISQGDVSLVFVPDVDLQRYQAHLRDAYNQGFKDGQASIPQPTPQGSETNV